uniref:Retrovirus-related Pol polyprotein from transposon TNT 1-94 n=1 Tax=Tanacetum cinerariifolium TaxID=118510 RepID=A0A699HV29_TANCI|nr:hypothetical protein [Tanacetum cinerariifolium]
MNGKNPLTLDYKTFVKTTRLNYNKRTYVCHLSPEVLDGKYSSTEQVNSVMQLIAYCLHTGTKVDIGDIIYSDLDQKFGFLLRVMSNSIFSKDPYKVTEIELMAFMIAVNNQEDSVSPLSFSGKKKKEKSQTVSKPKPKTHGPEASGTLPQKRKKAKTNKNTTEATETPPSEDVPTKDLEKTYSVSLGKTAHPQDTEGNTQFAIKDPILHAMMALVNHNLFLRVKLLIPKTQGEMFSLMIRDCLLQFLMRYTRLRYRSLNKNKGDTSFKVELDTQSFVLTTASDVQALLLSHKELNDESKDDVFEAKDEMDEGIQQTGNEDTQSPRYTKVSSTKEHHGEKETAKEPEKEQAEEEPTKISRAIPISTIIPITRPNPEIGLIKFSPRPPLTNTTLEFLVSTPEPVIIGSSSGPVIDITPPEQPKSLPVAPKANKGKGIATEETKEPKQPDEPIRFLLKFIGKYINLQVQRVVWSSRIFRMRLKHGLITNVKIHPNTKPAVLTVYKGNDRRNFNVLKFADFRVTDLDELGPIIEKKQDCCDEAFQRMSDINKVRVDALFTYLVMASNITTAENTRSLSVQSLSESPSRCSAQV